MLKIDMNDIDIEKFVSIKKGTNSNKYVEDNSIDLNFISTYTRLDGNGASSTIFEVNENLFDYAIEKLDTYTDSFELNTDLDNDRFHVKFGAGLYHNLYEKQNDKKLEINIPTGKYIWPISSINRRGKTKYKYIW
ncbi:MAG: hypothetical protein N4A63_13850 [Vallitalea sp.]|jgi:hypothetical protein|nr:hypothetical protein [Vallitalea sp.]